MNDIKMDEDMKEEATQVVDEVTEEDKVTEIYIRKSKPSDA